MFAQYRVTTTHLVEELNKVKGVRAERFVGQASKIRDKGLSQDEQASRIDDFRKKVSGEFDLNSEVDCSPTSE